MEAYFRTDFTLQDADAPVVTPTAARDFHNGSGGNGEGVTVVVRDSGIDATHPLFEDANIEQPDIDGLPTTGRDRVGHGTLVASIIHVEAPAAKLISVPIFGGRGRTDMQTIRRSYEYIMDRFGDSDQRVLVNDSWGSTQDNPILNRLHNRMENAGVDSIVAAGNTDRNSGSPATAKTGYGVAGVRLNGRMASFSSPTDDIAAPAVNVAGAKSRDASMGEPVPYDDYDEVMKDSGGPWNMAPGTSFAAPRVCGYAADYISRVQLQAEPDERRRFERAFNSTAVDVPNTGEDGQGYLNYGEALDAEPGPRTVDATVWSLPWGDSDFFNIDADIFESGEYEVDVDALEEAFETK